MASSESHKYRIVITRAAQRGLSRLPKDVLSRVDRAIQSLAAEPRPSRAKKLKGANDRYRLRIGDYRVIYEIIDDELIVLIIDAGHRKDIYRP
jgi:mRNA interferase RelE/StbE